MADYNLNDIYQDYKEEGGTLDKEIFKDLCEDFNQCIMDEIIYNGRTFMMGNFLSGLSIGRIKRDFSKRAVNWKASNELKQQLLDEGKKLYDSETGEGHKWLVYYTDDWYCRFYWSKSLCQIPNKTAYSFTATRGPKGNKRKLKNHLNEEETAYKKYRVLN